tara:strand:+ start:1495 stop:1752 length:258 start_codon:yes stop_codon:yes gene_type:complete
MNENEILEMGVVLKKKYEEIEIKEKHFIRENNELKKHLISVYGFSRILDVIMDNNIEIPLEMNTMIEILREYMSNVCEDFLILTQ